MTIVDHTYKATVLVVDDNPDDVVLISELLRDNYTVRLANSGEKALRIAADKPPDLIVLDIMMPEMDGYEVCRRLKADTKVQDIPVIFLTAKVAVEDEERAFEMGAADYVAKPISPRILLARVKTHIALKGASDSLRENNAFLQLMVSNVDYLRDRNGYMGLEIARRMAHACSQCGHKTMSHKIVTPLTIITEMAGLIRHSGVTPEQSELLDQIVSASQYVSGIVNAKP